MFPVELYRAFHCLGLFSTGKDCFGMWRWPVLDKLLTYISRKSHQQNIEYTCISVCGSHVNVFTIFLLCILNTDTSNRIFILLVHLQSLYSAMHSLVPTLQHALFK